MLRNRFVQIALVAAWIALAAFGTTGLVQRLTTGHELANYGSYIPWGMWVSAYIYFIGLSAGSFLLSSLVYVFGVHRLEPIAKLSLFVAVITLVLALVAILFDLGHMERFYYVFTRPNFRSMMAWMVWLYTGYFVLLISELVLALRAGRPGLNEAQRTGNRRVLRVLGAIGVPLAIAFHGGVGALFGTVVARGLWHSPIYPILFLTGALLSGGALMTVIVALFWPQRDAAWRSILTLLSRIVLGLVAFDVMLEWAEYSIPMWYGVGSEYEQLSYILFGPYWWVFWIVHIAFGVVLPVALLWRGRNPLAIGFGSALIVLTFFAIRLNLVIPGLVTPELAGLETAYAGSRLSFEYLPSVFEWQILVGLVAMGTAMFFLGYWLLPITPRSEQGATS